MRRFRASVALVAVLATATACGTVKTTPGVPPKGQPYRVAAPDMLEITVRPEPAIRREALVRPDGFISFELIGDVQVEGRSVEEIREEITTRISRYVVRPDVTVSLQESRSRRIYVLGEVKREGAYPLVGRVTAIDALAQSMGPQLLAATNRAMLVRFTGETREVYPIRFEDIIEKGDPRTNYELMPGDIVYIPPGISAQIGYAIQVIFFPLQQILGLGRTAAGTARGF
jgi:polysaccharide export outer membrane protein